MARERFQRRLGLSCTHNLNQLYFLKLVLSNQTPGVAPVAPCFASKARGMCDVLETGRTQRVSVKNLISHDVRDGNFSRWR